MDNVTTSIQFSIVSGLENSVKVSLVIWDHNRKASHGLRYRHSYGLSMMVFSLYCTYEVAEGTQADVLGQPYAFDRTTACYRNQGVCGG